MRCFNCGKDMKKEAYNNALIDRCEKCGGIWLDRGELDKVVNYKKGDAESDFWYDIKTERYIEERFPMPGGCMKCGGEVVDYSKDGLFFDRCKSCKGMFFERAIFEDLLRRRTFVGKISRKWDLIKERIGKCLKKRS